jgi:hypothetical protein
MIVVPRVPFGSAAHLAGLVVLACALPLRAQVTQPQVTQPAPVTRPRPNLAPPQAPKGDLVIESVTLDRTGIGAYVSIKNVGTERVDVPGGGSIIARGEPAMPGGWGFAQLQDPRGEGYVLFPNSGTSLRLAATEGWCPAGKPGAVTFRVNPDNTLAEGNKANNTVTLPASSIVGDIASGAVELQSQRWPRDQYGRLIDPNLRNVLPRGFPADLALSFHNPGPGYVLGCPGVPLLRDVQSPVASFYGLRTYNYLNNYSIVAYPGGDFGFRSVGAVGPIPLAPGTYTWQFQFNPQGAIAESNPANNTVTITFTVIELPTGS